MEYWYRLHKSLNQRLWGRVVLWRVHRSSVTMASYSNGSSQTKVFAFSGRLTSYKSIASLNNMSRFSYGACSTSCGLIYWPMFSKHLISPGAHSPHVTTPRPFSQCVAKVNNNRPAVSLVTKVFECFCIEQTPDAETSTLAGIPASGPLFLCTVMFSTSEWLLKWLRRYTV